jgi:citrate synthase
MLIHQSSLINLSRRPHAGRMNTTTQTTTHSGAPARASGLEGVVVADTALSHVDGERGRLVVRGQDIEVLARDTGFEAAWVRVWHGRAGTAHELEAARAGLGAARVEAWRQLEPALGAVLGLDDVMAAIAAGLPPAVTELASFWRNSPVSPLSSSSERGAISSSSRLMSETRG